MRPLSIRACFTGLLLTAGLCSTAQLSASDASGPGAVVRQYTSDQGAWQAVAIRDTEPATPQIHRHVLLIDTSASQVGVVREAGLRLVSDVARQLPATDHVHVLAMDTSCQSLTRGFVTPVSAEFAEAMRRLEVRTPLGATNLRSALKSVMEMTDGQPTSVLWIGDGLSSIHAFRTDEIADVTGRLTGSDITVHSVVLGPKTNQDLPAVLANLTGGAVHRLPEGVAGASAIAAALQSAGTRIERLNANGKKVSPLNHSGWLRADRHAVLLGENTSGYVSTLEAVLEDGRIVRWDDVTVEDGGAEVKQLCEITRKSDGFVTPVASLEMLNQATADFDQLIRSSAVVASRLQRLGQVRQARLVAQRAAELDGENSEVTTVLTALRESDPFGFDDTANDQFSESDRGGDALDEVEALIRVRTQRLQQTTDAKIEEADSYAREQPEYAESLLKDLLETIQSETGVTPEAQDELERRVINAISGVQVQRDKAAMMQQANAVRRAVEEAQEHLIVQQEVLESDLQTIIDQVRGLLDRARHGDINSFEDAEAAARVAITIKPGNGPATQALMVSEAAGQLDKARRLRELRADRFLETLYQVELSHVPFPDEPPVQYPPSDVWRALTLTRKPRYQAFSLQNESEVEGWLNRMLKEPIPALEFRGETPLSEILDFLAEHYTQTWGSLGGSAGSEFRMTIWPDDATLELENIDSLDDVVISDIRLEGVPLRTALKLIFEKTTDPPLTYVIQDDVMKITTVEEANSENSLVTRVYPVGDLVIPPDPPQGAGGGFGGGGVGGGGFGGGGVGGGGFGGGGVGGGAFSVPPEWDVLLEASQDGITGDALKKRQRR